MHSFLNEMKINTNDHRMRINEDKTKIMSFKNTTKSDFLPNLTLDQEPLEKADSIGFRVCHTCLDKAARGKKE